MVDYFKIKYLINECFYYEVLVNERTYEQAVGICEEAFMEYINGSDIESIVAKSTIILLRYRYNVKISINDFEAMKDIINIYKQLDDTIWGNKESVDFFAEEIEFLNEKMAEYGQKHHLT